MQIADFAAKRHQDRRQYEFRIFIACVTLLALAIYKAPDIADHCCIVALLVGVSYFLYILWAIRVSTANRNDGHRRDYYLEKAEDILCSCYGVRPPPNEYRPAQNKIKEVPKMWQVLKGWCQLCENWSIGFTALFPLLLVILLVYRLCFSCD